MVEKFSDYESAGYLAQTGTFVFEVKDYELKDSKSGTPMAVFTVEAPEGQTTLYHSLNPKARWSYNNLIKACLKLNTKAKVDAIECDYEIIGNQLVGKKFKGTVERQPYEKEVKIPLDDGTFETCTEKKDCYKIVSYDEA